MNNLSKCLFCSLSVSVWFENNFEIFREWRRWSHRGLVCTGKSWERFQFWFLNHDEENWWLKGWWWWLQWLFQRWGDWAVWQIGPPCSQWDAWRQGPCNDDHHRHCDHGQKRHHHQYFSSSIEFCCRSFSLEMSRLCWTLLSTLTSPSWSGWLGWPWWLWRWRRWWFWWCWRW